MICTYRHFDADGALLYVGCTKEFYNRTSIHRHSPWAQRIARIELDRFDCLKEAQRHEYHLISTLKPIFNVVSHPLKHQSVRVKAEHEGEVIARTRVFLEKASVREIIEFAEMSRCPLTTILEIIEERQVIGARTVDKLKASLDYLEANK